MSGRHLFGTQISVPIGTSALDALGRTQVHRGSKGAGEKKARSILSVAMMLRMTLNRPDEADLLEKAVDVALAAGARTADIAEPGAKRLSTAEMGDAVLSALEKVAANEKERV